MTYRFLKTIAVFIEITAFLVLLAGVVISMELIPFMSNNTGATIPGILFFFIGVLITLVPFVLIMGFAQFIRLMINVANDISTISSNAYFIAQVMDKKQ